MVYKMRNLGGVCFGFLIFELYNSEFYGNYTVEVFIIKVKR